MSLTKIQKQQVYLQIKEHQLRQGTNAEVLLGNNEKICLSVKENVMRPDIMASKVLAQYLYYIKKDYKDKIVIDMGCGCGIQGIVMGLNNAEKVYFIDIDPNAIDNTNENINEIKSINISYQTIVSDLFNNFKDKITDEIIIVFNHPFFAGDSTEFAHYPVAKSMLDDGKLIHSFLEETKERFNENLNKIIMPFFKLAGPVNDPGIQAPIHGYVVTKMLSVDINCGLQNGEIVIYELMLHEKAKKTKNKYTTYQKIVRVVDEKESICDILKSPKNGELITWTEPIPENLNDLQYKTIFKIDWGEFLDEYDRKTIAEIMQNIVFSPMTRDLLSTHSNNHIKGLLSIYLVERERRIPSKFVDSKGEILKYLQEIYEKFLKKVVIENGFDLTAEIHRYLHAPDSESFILEFSKSDKNNDTTIKEEYLEGPVYSYIDKLIRIVIGNKTSNSTNDDDIFKDSPCLKKFLKRNNDLSDKFLKIYIPELCSFFIKGINFLTLIPIRINYGKKPIPIGAILVASSKTLCEHQIHNLIRGAEKYLEPIRIAQFTSHIQKHSIQAAIGSIMSRNMSHNLGSHVISTIATEQTLESIHILNTKEFLKYLQNRMDFIAQLTTEFPQWTYPQWFIKQIFKEFFKQIHIRNYLAISENLKLKDISFEIKINGKSVCVLNESSEQDSFNFNQINTDLLVAIPGGMIGNHSVYVILEDIVRNSAKHSYSKTTPKEGLRITINLENNPESDYVKVTIWDNVSEINGQNSNKDLSSDSDEANVQNLPLHQRMNHKLIKGLIDQEASLRRENWGLAEMKICAGFLQKEPIKRIGSEDRSVLQIIKAVAVQDNSKKYLGYEFKIPKPKEVLILSSNPKKWDNIKLKDYSIYVEEKFKDRDYEFIVIEDNGENSVNSKEPAEIVYSILTGYLDNDKNKNNQDLKGIIEFFPYRLFIVTERITKDTFNNSFLSKRIVLLNKHDYEEITKSFSKSNGENFSEFKRWLYLQWLVHLIKQKNLGKINLEINVKGRSQTLENKTLLDELNIKSLESIYQCEETINKILEKIGILLPGKNNSSNLNEWWEVVMKNIPKELSDFISCQEQSEEIHNSNVNCSNISYLKHTSYTAHFPNSKSNKLYFENLSGNAIHFPIISNPSNDEYYQFKVLCQLIENGLIKIAICDERICNSTLLNSKDNDGVCFYDYLQAAGITIINKFGNWGCKEHECKISDVETFHKINVELNYNGTITKSDVNGQKNNKSEDVEVDVIIIHQGILDKLKINGNVKEILYQIKEKIPFVVITSGRGKPSNIPEGVKFIPFSSIESTLLSKPHHKFILTSTLMNL